MFLLADQVLGGQLAARLRAWREAGVSLRSIQALLEIELGVKPALETVRGWVKSAEADGDQNGGEGEAA